MSRMLAMPGLIGAWVLVAGITLVALVLHSPYTHSNLAPGVEVDYHRTPQTIVGAAPSPFHGPGLAAGMTAADQIQRGRELIVANQCATCHGLDGRGGLVNKPIVGFSAAELRDRTSKGPGEMPSFGTTLSDDDLAAIAAYLDSMKTSPPS